MRKCLSCKELTHIRSGEMLMPYTWSCFTCGWTPSREDGVAITAPELVGSLSGFDAQYFPVLAAIESGHFWFEPRNKLIKFFAERFFPLAQSYLEIGCGTGFVLAMMARHLNLTRVVASELHPLGFRTARQRLQEGATEWIQMDARAIPAREEFDLIGAFDVIEHIEDDEAVLRQAHDALREGGGILLTVPQHRWLWSDFDDSAYHIRRYQRGELEGKLKRAGFRILASTSYTSILLPLMMMARLLRRRRNQAPSTVVEDELRVPIVLNAPLKYLLELEVLATRAGMRWPIGGSRVVVATRGL